MQHYHVASYPGTEKRKQQKLQINQILLKILVLHEAYLATGSVLLSNALTGGFMAPQNSPLAAGSNSCDLRSVSKLHRKHDTSVESYESIFMFLFKRYIIRSLYESSLHTLLHEIQQSVCTCVFCVRDFLFEIVTVSTLETIQQQVRK